MTTSVMVSGDLEYLVGDQVYNMMSSSVARRGDSRW